MEAIHAAVQERPECRETIRQVLHAHSSDGGVSADEPFMVGSSPSMHDAFERIRNYAPYHVPVLITGESGTGKELAARALHERSPYARGSFVALNCGALPQDLVASELFGHEKGAFTGAVGRHQGHFERADGGTLFLDEIGQLPEDVQATLLRVLQEGSFRRIGGKDLVSVDTRIVAATNADLDAAVADGSFRADLFYRLNVLRVHLPPLRERTGDIRLLVEYFSRELAREMSLPAASFSDSAMEKLERHAWPGNVRELISTLRRALVMAHGETLTPDHLDLTLETARPDGPPRKTAARESDAAAAAETSQGSDLVRPAPPTDAERIRQALSECGGNVAAAARRLDLSRMTLYRRMRRYGIQARS